MKTANTNHNFVSWNRHINEAKKQAVALINKIEGHEHVVTEDFKTPAEAYEFLYQIKAI